MYWKIISISTLAMAFAVFGGGKAKKAETAPMSPTDDRAAEFSAVSKYELVNISVEGGGRLTASKKLLFVAFGNEYRVILHKNERRNPSLIRHSNVDPKKIHDEEHRFYTELNDSCHYQGTVESDADGQASSASISLCDRRGVRGVVHAFGRSLNIVPSAYFLDLSKDRFADHSLSDQHMVFLHNDSIDPMSVSKQNVRRRLQDDTNQHKVEMMIVNGAVRTEWYRSMYPVTWYETMVSDYQDAIHTLSNLYSGSDWGSDVGSISVEFVEIEVVFAYLVHHVYLAPTFTNDDCTAVNSECEINPVDWLYSLVDFLSASDSTYAGHYDNAVMVGNMPFANESTLQSYGASMCDNWWSCGVIYARYGTLYIWKSMAMSLGFNFGMTPDGVEGSDCGNDEGVMGSGIYGGSNFEEFSECSIEALQLFFAETNISCLNHSDSTDFSSNYDVDATLEPTPSPTTGTSTAEPTASSPTAPTTSTTGVSCFGLEGMDDRKNALYTQFLREGTYGEYDYFVSVFEIYAFFVDGNSTWYWSDTLGDTDSIKAYCSQSDLMQCYGDNLVVNDPESESTIYDCSAECDGSECVEIRSMTSYNGQWQRGGCYSNGSPWYYRDQTARYLCKYSAGIWLISTYLCDATSVYAYCYVEDAEDVLQCQNAFYITDGTQWELDPAHLITQC